MQTFEELLNLLASEHQRLERRIRELTLEVSPDSSQEGEGRAGALGDSDLSAPDEEQCGGSLHGDARAAAVPASLESRCCAGATATEAADLAGLREDNGSAVWASFDSSMPAGCKSAPTELDLTMMGNTSDAIRRNHSGEALVHNALNAVRRNSFRQGQGHRVSFEDQTPRSSQELLSNMTEGTTTSTSTRLPRSMSYMRWRSGSAVRALKVSSLHTATSPDLVINPEQSRFLERWDTITMAALAFVALVAPVQATMLETKFDWLFCVNCLFDMVFIIDMVLQFFIMYPIKTDSGQYLEDRRSHIARNYFKNWFVIDFCSILPWDLFGILGDSKEMGKMKAVKVIRLLRLLKLIRVLKASRVFRRFEVRMSITYGRLALLKFFVILSVITHWMANMWALTLVLVDESEGVARWIDDITDLEQGMITMTKDSPAKLYIACLYFTSYTITSVGYGDIGPKNIVERVVCTLMIIISGISWAVVLGQVCGIVANLDADEQVFRSTMDELNCMMTDRHMPRPIRRRLRSFFLSNKTVQRRQRHQDILSKISPGLQGEVVMELNRQWITKVPFLCEIVEEAVQSTGDSQFYFMVDISQKMQCEVHAQSEIFGVPQVLYILVRGLVTRYDKRYRSGCVWGTDFVLADTGLAEPVESFAVTYVEVNFLQRSDFMEVLERYKASCPELAKRVRRYCVWLAFQRAFMAEARRRMLELQTKQKPARRSRLRQSYFSEISDDHAQSRRSGVMSASAWRASQRADYAPPLRSEGSD